MSKKAGKVDAISVRITGKIFPEPTNFVLANLRSKLWWGIRLAREDSSVAIPKREKEVLSEDFGGISTMVIVWCADFTRTKRVLRTAGELSIPRYLESAI